MVANGVLRVEARRGARRAFTLVELLAVMVILAILAALVIPRITGRIGESKIKAAQADIAALSAELSLFEQDNDRFPTTEEGLEALIHAPGGNLPNWHRVHQKDDVNDPWGNPYIYRYPGSNGKDYDLSSGGPPGADKPITNGK